MIRTNRGGGARPRTVALGGVSVSRGREMGYFAMGSAIVLLLAADAGRLDALGPGTRLRVGQAIGRLAASDGTDHTS